MSSRRPKHLIATEDSRADGNVDISEPFAIPSPARQDKMKWTNTTKLGTDPFKDQWKRGWSAGYASGLKTGFFNG